VRTAALSSPRKEVDMTQEDAGSAPIRENTIPLNECRNGWVYRLSSRNLGFGVFVQASNGFIGIREKFNHKYLFTEYHRDTGVPFGTVCPKEELEPAPPGLVLKENGPLINEENGRVVVLEAGTEYPSPRTYRYADTSEICDPGEIVWSCNQPLHDYMLQIEAKYGPCTEERVAETKE
jgi:hypothetical protein